MSEFVCSLNLFHPKILTEWTLHFLCYPLKNIPWRANSTFISLWNLIWFGKVSPQIFNLNGWKFGEANINIASAYLDIWLANISVRNVCAPLDVILMRSNTLKIIHFLRWTVDSVQTFRIVYFNQIDLRSSEASLEIANIWIEDD